jgi:hypothetical protein
MREYSSIIHGVVTKIYAVSNGVEECANIANRE